MNPTRRRSKHLLLGLIAGACVAAAILIHQFYATQRSGTREEKARELIAIADVKAAAFASWRRERISNAWVLSSNEVLGVFVRDALISTHDPAAASKLRAWFNQLKGQYDYSRVMLFDSSAKLRLTSDPVTPALERGASGRAAETIRRRTVQFEDFHADGAGAVHLSVVAPLLDDCGSIVAAILLQIDPARFLYRHLETWPSQTQSGETLLVRRDGDDVLYLNELRHRRNTALKLRIPVTRSGLPEAQAVLGGEGVVEGKDYRGVAVLAAVRRIPDSPWFLVAKIDRAEVYSGLESRTRYFGAVTVLVLIVSGCVVSLAWSQRESRHYRELYDAEARTKEEIHRLNAELEQRVLERTAKLEASNKELEAFAYSIAHDLRTPLRGIDGWSMALLEDYAAQLDERGRDYLDRTRYEAQRMGMLIDDLLQLARLTRAEMRLDQIDLTSLAVGIAARLRAIQPDREIEFVIQPSLWAVGDAQLLNIALENLLDNAVKFTGPRTPARIEFGRADQNGEPMFYVRDNGVGFNMAHAGILFGAFQRLHKSSEFPGTGVGLATVQRVIRRHGGQVWAEAEVDKGATFYFKIGVAA